MHLVLDQELDPMGTFGYTHRQNPLPDALLTPTVQNFYDLSNYKYRQVPITCERYLEWFFGGTG